MRYHLSRHATQRTKGTGSRAQCIHVINKACLASAAALPTDDPRTHITNCVIGSVDFKLSVRDATVHFPCSDQQCCSHLMNAITIQPLIHGHKGRKFCNSEWVTNKRSNTFRQSPIRRALVMNGTPSRTQGLVMNLRQVSDDGNPELQPNQLNGQPMIFQLLRGK